MKNLLLSFFIIFLFSNTSFLAAQNVGINTTTPQTALHVADDNIVTGGLTIGTGNVSDGGNLRLLSNLNHWNLDNFQGNLRFFTETGFGTGGIERFRINENGNAGFNASSPSVGLVIQNPPDINTGILRVETADGTSRFQVREDGRAGFNGIANGTGLLVRNPSASNPIILNLLSADDTQGFQVREDGRAGFNEIPGGVALNVRNPSASNPIILNVGAADGFNPFQVLQNGITVMNGLTNMNGRAGIRTLYTNTTFNIQGQAQEDLLLNVELSNGDFIFRARDDTQSFINGEFFVNGNKSFLTDHPLDPANKSLRHYCVEGPEVLNVYSGTVILDAQGKAQVELPDYFETLNKDFRYQLSSLGGYAPIYLSKKVSNNQFEIAGGYSGLEVSWRVTGVRNDPWFRDHPYQAVHKKTGREKGRYYYPEGYGMPAEMGIRRMGEDTEREMEPLKMEDN